MQLYRADLRCAEPVANGFSCNEQDTRVFTHAGEPLTRELAESAVNELSDARCWKCFAKNWRLRAIVPIVYRSNSQAIRT